ncbi:kinesin heavy chain, putative, partial [Perkinsus marinus ATCC 50983]
VTTDGSTVAIDVETDQLVGPPKVEPKCFTYDSSFPPSITQDELYASIGKPIRDSVLNGFNNCLFAYGQTGSGKTHSILGTEDSPGVLRYLIDDIFSAAKEKHEGKQLCVTVSFLEIYNEQLRDLLDPQTIPDAIALQRRSVTDNPNSFAQVPNLTEAACGSLDECLSFLNLGLKQRATAQTNMNSQSSRSHSVFTIRLRKRISASQREHRTSSVHLIDLAGSERTKRSGAVGQRMKEGQSINTSLSVLGQVISKLSIAKASSASHIPFRQSKLTYLLTDALTGNSHTCMLAAVSPARHDQEETLSTLRFASSVKKIKTVRAVPSGCNLGSS